MTRCRSLNFPGHVYPFCPGFFAAVRAFRPDIVHGFGLGYWSADAAALLSPRLPVIISPTGGRYRKGRLYGILRALFLRRTRRVPLWTALSRDEESSLIRDYGPEVPPIELLPPAVDLDELSAPRPDPFPSLPGSGRILFAGRLSRDKGVPDLLEAFSGARRERAATLILAGPDYGLGLPSAIQGAHVAGTLTREELVGAYQHCEIFVLPSYHEGYGIVLAEAMAAGKPVVAYDNSSQPELCRDEENGILVPTGDRARLGAALARLLDDSDLRMRLGDSGRARASREFGQEILVERVLGLYRRVLAGQGGRQIA